MANHTEGSFPSDPPLRDNGYPVDWVSRRKAVFKRDSFICQECGSRGGPGASVELNAHHRVPKAQGGSHALSNLQTLCYDCHAKKHPHMSPRSGLASLSGWQILAILAVIGLIATAVAWVMQFVLLVLLVGIALGSFCLFIAGGYWVLNVVLDTREYNVAATTILTSDSVSDDSKVVPAYSQVWRRIGFVLLELTFVFIGLVISSLAGHIVFFGLALLAPMLVYRYRDSLHDSSIDDLPATGPDGKSWEAIRADIRPPLGTLEQKLLDVRVLIGGGGLVYALGGGAIISSLMDLPFHEGVTVAIIVPLIILGARLAD